MSEQTNTTKLNESLNKVAKSYSIKIKIDELIIRKGIKSKIIKNGVPSYTLIRYLNGSNEPSLVNARIIHDTLLEYDSKILMEDIF